MTITSSVRALWSKCAIGALVAVAASAGVNLAQADAAKPSCSAVSIRVLNSSLGISATKVTTVHPASPAGAVICSYYGASGRQKNEATINYVPAGPAQFIAVQISFAKRYAVRTVSGLFLGAYYYRVAPNNFLYVLDGTTQVQIYGIASVAKLEKLARKLPGF